MTQNETKFMDSAIALAETLHFTKAAKRLRISQPQLTKNIQDLEDILGVRLFDRDRKTVALNDAGKVYLEQAKLSIMYAERASQAAKEAMREADVALHIGRSPYTDPFLASMIEAVELPLYARLRVEVSSRYSCELVDEVLAGALDVAIVTEPTDSALLSTLQIEELPFYIAMSRQDKLAGEPSVRLEALADRCWILFERRLHPPLYDQVLRIAKEKGIIAQRIRHITAPEEAFPLVETGECIAFVVKTGALLLARNGVTVRPLSEPALRLRTCLVVRADNQSKLVSAFVRTYVRRLSPPKKGVQSVSTGGVVPVARSL